MVQRYYSPTVATPLSAINEDQLQLNKLIAKKQSRSTKIQCSEVIPSFISQAANLIH